MNRQQERLGERGEEQRVKVRYRVARRVLREYAQGALLDEEELEREMEALHDDLVGE